MENYSRNDLQSDIVADRVLVECPGLQLRMHFFVLIGEDECQTILIGAIRRADEFLREVSKGLKVLENESDLGRLILHLRAEETLPCLQIAESIFDLLQKLTMINVVFEDKVDLRNGIERICQGAEIEKATGFRANVLIRRFARAFCFEVSFDD